MDTVAAISADRILYICCCQTTQPAGFANLRPVKFISTQIRPTSQMVQTFKAHLDDMFVLSEKNFTQRGFVECCLHVFLDSILYLCVQKT